MLRATLAVVLHFLGGAQALGFLVVESIAHDAGVEQNDVGLMVSPLIVSESSAKKCHGWSLLCLRASVLMHMRLVPRRYASCACVRPSDLRDLKPSWFSCTMWEMDRGVCRKVKI